MSISLLYFGNICHCIVEGVCPLDIIFSKNVSKQISLGIIYKLILQR